MTRLVRSPAVARGLAAAAHLRDANGAGFSLRRGPDVVRHVASLRLRLRDRNAGALAAQARRQPAPFDARLHVRRIETIRTVQPVFRAIGVDPAPDLVVAVLVDMPDIDRAAVAV